MRKIITILLVIGMCISLIACGGNESSDKETDTKESADKVEVELEYYEEYETLPTADSIISADPFRHRIGPRQPPRPGGCARTSRSCSKTTDHREGHDRAHDRGEP